VFIEPPIAQRDRPARRASSRLSQRRGHEFDLEGDTMKSLGPLGPVPPLHQLTLRGGALLDPASLAAERPDVGSDCP
jgi:hypothetical protein